MKINPNKHRRILETLKPEILKAQDLHNRLSELAVFYHLPLLTLVLYAQRKDVVGPQSELDKMARYLVEFYKYEEPMPWEDEINA